MKGILLASASAVVVITSPGYAAAQSQAAQQNGRRSQDDAEQQQAQQKTVEQQVNEAANQDIVVTATRRAESLKDVPLSITALTPEQLIKTGTVGFEGLAANTPGVTLNKPSQNFNIFTARGIATNGYSANLQSAVAIYVDELPISANGNSAIIDPNLFDVKRVEFLRGPQGTLFGSSSLSGAVRILTKEPDLDKIDSSFLLDLGQTGSDSTRVRANAMLNVPIVKDRLALRVVGFYRHEDGYLDNLGTGVHNSNTLRDYGGRAVLKWNATDRLSAKFLVSYENSYPQDSSLTSPSLGEEKRFSVEPDLFTGELTNYNATIDYQFDGAHLTSSSTLSRYNQRFFVDLGNTFAYAIPFKLDASAYDHVFVQETRIASDPGGDWDWVVGGYYYRKRRDIDYRYRSSLDFLRANDITGLGDSDVYQSLGRHLVQHEFAAFGQLTYHFSDKVWITGGLRYGRTDVQATVEPGGFDSNYLGRALAGASGPLTITSVEPGTGDKAEVSKPQYKVSVSYAPSSAVTTYASISTGFRAPVVNRRGGRPSSVDPNDITIPEGAKSDNLINYEVGLKGRWFGGKLTANLAAYFIDWNDIQVQANRVSDSVQFVTNIGGAHSKGIELELNGRPLKGLNLSLYGSLNDANVNDITDSQAAISGAVDGARLAFPHFQGTARARYNFAVASDTTAHVAASIHHVGSFPGLFPNTPGSPGVQNPTYDYTEAYDNVNAQVGIVTGKLSVTAYVENLLDDHHITYVHPEAFLASRYGTLRPRTFGVRLGWNLF